MERLSRSFDIVTQSYRILLHDKELMVLPLIAGVINISVALSFAFGFGLTPSVVRAGGFDTYAPLFLLFVVVYTVGIFFQAAVVAGATERMRGGDPTVGSALSAAGRRIGSIVAWALVAATVGTVIRAIHDKAGFLGQLLTRVLGIAWSLATFFIVPVLVLEERSIRDSFTRSVSVFKETWGESIAVPVTVGLAALVMWVALMAIAAAVALFAGRPAGIGLFVAGAIALTVFFSTLQGVYLATLFRYATEGWVPAGFSGEFLQQSFVSKEGTNHVTLNLHRKQ
ncbi:MAG TPA: DUF6159 family protein [Vicinamibacterales bacterium]|nr:DUF6159 family protein [Vicinamibacterales bacterium]